jgi:hypothetical protein
MSSARIGNVKLAAVIAECGWSHGSCPLILDT